MMDADVQQPDKPVRLPHAIGELSSTQYITETCRKARLETVTQAFDKCMQSSVGPALTRQTRARLAELQDDFMKALDFKGEQNDGYKPGLPKFFDPNVVPQIDEDEALFRAKFNPPSVKDNAIPVWDFVDKEMAAGNWGQARVLGNYFGYFRYRWSLFADNALI